MVEEIATRIVNNILSNYAELEREEEVDTIEDDMMDAYNHCIPQADEDLYPCRIEQHGF